MSFVKVGILSIPSQCLTKEIIYDSQVRIDLKAVSYSVRAM